MATDIYTGKSVRLVIPNLEELGDLLSKWDKDSEYQRLLNGDNAYLFNPKQIQAFFEKEISSMHFFLIQRLEDDRNIGLIDLSGFNWTVRNAWVGIGIGERDLWGKGYGTDAMRILLRYAFMELNLNRVSLNVFEVNPRGIASYKKAGFQEEGRMREVLLKAGKRVDLIFMSVLRDEWMQIQKNAE